MAEIVNVESVGIGELLLGDEAVARGATDAGLTAAYGYPGTPSTEILEHLIARSAAPRRPVASWCANEKTAYEAALGVSMAGGRSLVTMKHVGLNVAADPFVNSALLAIHGGLVLAVADDPGMHSSQNEQDSRFYADFARTLCLEPSDQQQCYDMAREAFDLSESLEIPVVLRLVTRLAHSRGGVVASEPRKPNRASKPADPSAWILLPANARERWRELLDRQAELEAYVDSSDHNVLELNAQDRTLGVITTGIARNYYEENRPDLPFEPSHLHIGTYPVPKRKILELTAHARAVLVLEEGQPWVERAMRGLYGAPTEVRGKMSGHLPLDGELTPESVRVALGLPPRAAPHRSEFVVPSRPPQLCAGCPHRDAYAALRLALEGYATPIVTSDIGCYTLGALAPFRAIESCVCMGASLGMARGASDAGIRPAVAVVGDSTFLHSGVTPLMDAVAANADVTVLILDNSVVAMTGTQPTILPPSSMRGLLLGIGVDPEHCHLMEAHPQEVDAMAALIRRELEHRGLSVIVFERECIESARKRKTTKR